jgi:hypothetical protein
VQRSVSEHYLAELRMAFESLDEEILRTEMIEEIVSRVNREAKGSKKNVTVALPPVDHKTLAVKEVNEALRSGDPMSTIAVLQNPALGLSGVLPMGAALYHAELRYIQRESQADLR